MTLDDTAHGETVEIVDVPGEGSSTARLMALGFLAGLRVRVSRVAPLGDPISIEMDGREVSLRRSEARLIEVRRV